jgi:hypothetical protein
MRTSKLNATTQELIVCTQPILGAAITATLAGGIN